MHLRPLVPMGLALFAATGCQSYFPYGYGNTNPYPPMSGPYSPPAVPTPSQTSPSGTSPSGSRQYPTPANGQMNLNSGSNRGQPSGGRVPDARTLDPGNPPTTLGAPASGDDDTDSIRDGRSSLDGPRNRLDDAAVETDESMSSLDDQKFVSPTPFRPASASSDDAEMRRPASRQRPSPFKKDPNGYSWLRGVVSRDPKTNSWRITYSRDPLDDDPYKGSLTLVDDRVLDTLMDDDVVLVKGDVDRSVLDKYGKPSYRATTVLPLKPKDN
ncbi:MAG: hypothetical protein ACM3U2_11035 [Deltaproteobacteria bacterium]